MKELIGTGLFGGIFPRSGRLCWSSLAVAQNGCSLMTWPYVHSQASCRECVHSRTCTMSTSAAGSSLKRRHAQLHVNCQRLFFSVYKAHRTFKYSRFNILISCTRRFAMGRSGLQVLCSVLESSESSTSFYHLELLSGRKSGQGNFQPMILGVTKPHLTD